MIVAGLTGGIASGKSTILKHIKKLKIPVHDSDGVVSLLYKKPTQKFLTELFKQKLLDVKPIKKINKKEIRKRVLKDAKKLKALEIITHKHVSKERGEFLKKNKKLKKRIVFLDIPLLFENKLNSICDVVILVFCPLKTRLRRALNRKNMDKKTFYKIVKLQMPEKTKRAKSDYVINTQKPKKECYNKIENIIEALLAK